MSLKFNQNITSETRHFYVVNPPYFLLLPHIPYTHTLTKNVAWKLIRFYFYPFMLFFALPFSAFYSIAISFLFPIFIPFFVIFAIAASFCTIICSIYQVVRVCFFFHYKESYMSSNNVPWKKLGNIFNQNISPPKKVRTFSSVQFH